MMTFNVGREGGNKFFLAYQHFSPRERQSKTSHYEIFTRRYDVDRDVLAEVCAFVSRLVPGIQFMTKSFPSNVTAPAVSAVFVHEVEHTVHARAYVLVLRSKNRQREETKKTSGRER